MLLCTCVFSMNLQEPKAVNQHLKQTIEQQNNFRILPQSNIHSIAMDLFLWKYTPSNPEYYHGAGYWFDTFLELRPYQGLALNLKLSAVNGTISKGYVTGGKFIHNISAFWSPFKNEKIEMRFLDLGRITMAAGLIVEDREATGVQLSSKLGNFQTKFTGCGTNVVQVDGDLLSLESKYMWKPIELGAIFYYFNDTNKYYTNETSFWSKEVRRHFGSLFLKDKNNKGLLLSIEAGMGDRQKKAGLIKLGFKNTKSCTFCYDFYLQARKYEDDTIDIITGRTNYNYVPFDLVERNTTSAHNLLLYYNSTSYSAHFNFRYYLKNYLVLKSLNEHVRIQYGQNNTRKNMFWYKQSVGVCPVKSRRNDCIHFYVSNKILDAYSPTSMRYESTSGEYPYINRFHMGVETKFLF